MKLEEAKHCVGPGWHPLLEEVFRNLPDADIVSVKEKYAGLRIDAWSITAEQLDYLLEVEDRSHKICEVCGKPGRVVVRNSWLFAVCEEHHKKLLSGEPLA